MGDRWSFPRQASSATQVWLPITVHEDTCSILEYWPVWDSESISQVTVEGDEEAFSFRSNQKGDTISYTFKGSQIIVSGKIDCHSVFADFTIDNETDKLVHQSIIDFYSLVTDSNIKYVSPKFPQGNYTLTVSVMGENGVWSDKTGTQFGSDDYFVTLERITICKDNEE